MQLILIPGLWLDAGSWHDVVPTIDDAGFDALPVTLPNAPEAHLTDWVAAVVAHIDAADEPVALVGHSGGGNVAWGAADARPESIARVVFVDTVPVPDGADITGFPVVDGVIPFPGWDTFDTSDIADLDAATREHIAAEALAVPAAVPTDPLHLHDTRRHGIPVTVLSGVQTQKSSTRSCRTGRATTMSGARSPTARSCASAQAIGRSSPSRNGWERSSCARSSADDQWPIPRPPSTGMTAPET